MDKNLVERGESYAKKNWFIIRIRSYLGTLFNRFPRIKKIVLYFWYYIKNLRYQKQLEKLSINKIDEVELDKTYWMDPKKIQYLSLNEFDVCKYKGKIIDGNWDLLERPFEELDVYVAFKERLIEGKKWETTVFYQRILSEIQKGKFLWGCKNQIDFDNRLKKIEKLFENIKNDGYKSQKELQPKSNLDPMHLEDEVAVNIGRNGELLFNNGAHRLSIAKLLNIKKIPVKITVRHPQWVKQNKPLPVYLSDKPNK